MWCGSVIATGSDGTPGWMVSTWVGDTLGSDGMIWICESLMNLDKGLPALEGCQMVALCWFSLVHVYRHGKGCATCDLQIVAH